MICYRDRAFFFSKNCTGECGRKIEPHHIEEAKKLGLPFSGRNFCDQLEKEKKQE